MNDLSPLQDLPTPPQLAEACGYLGIGRWVMFYWRRMAGELVCYDGASELIGANWWAWRTFEDHPATVPWLCVYNFGDTQREAKHALVLDRKTNKAFVSSIAAGRAHVESRAEEQNLHARSQLLLRGIDMARQREHAMEVATAIGEWLDTHVKYLPALPQNPEWFVEVRDSEREAKKKPFEV